MTKDQLIEQYRDINTDRDWWDHVYDDFQETLAREDGIHVSRMFFSGFWSQGDGACFEGAVDDWEVFLKSLGYTDPILIQHAKVNWSFSVLHHGYYYHENCTHFNGDLSMPDGYSDDHFVEYFSPYAPDDFRTQAWLSILAQFMKTDFEQEFTDRFKSRMRRLYKELEQEYEYLTSDEAVWESIQANGLDTTEENDE